MRRRRRDGRSCGVRPFEILRRSRENDFDVEFLNELFVRANSSLDVDVVVVADDDDDEEVEEEE